VALHTEAITKYTNLDLTTTTGTLFKYVQFISQSVPDIRKKLQKQEQGPKSPQNDLLNSDFRVFNNRKDEAKRRRKNI
jgi:hypothetical protein